MVLSMLCWGSWANTIKLAGNRWRFELFYFDYAFGVLLLAVLAAFTFGTTGGDLSFIDDFSLTGYRKMAYAIAAGCVFNLANILLVGAIAVAGMAVAFPIGIGLALVIGVIWNYALNPQGHPYLLFGGVALVAAAIVLDALAYAGQAKSRPQPAAAAPPADVRGRSKPSRGDRPVSSWKGIGLSLGSGLLMGSFYPLVEMSKTSLEGVPGLRAYSIALLFSIGVFGSTFVYNVYFMNLPIQGRPVELTAYFTGTRRQHLLGIAGGAIWCMGAIANFAASSAPPEVQVGPAISYAIGQGATMVSALWGLLVWKEFAGATSRVRILLALMLILFVAGLALVSVAPLYSK